MSRQKAHKRAHEKQVPIENRLLPPKEVLGALDDSALLNVAKNEAEAWRWLFELIDSGACGAEPYNGYLQLRVAVHGVDPERSQTLASELRSTVESLLEDELIVRAGSARGDFVRGFTWKRPNLALAILSNFLGRTGDVSGPDQIEACILSVLFKKGLVRRAEKEETVVARVRRDWAELYTSINTDVIRLRDALQDRLGVLSSSVRQVREATTELREHSKAVELQKTREIGEMALSARAEVTSRLQDFQRDLEESLTRGKEAIDSALNTASKRLEDLRSTYVAQLALKAPTSYWRTKAEEHKRAKRFCLYQFAWTGPVALALLVSVALWQLPGAGESGIRGVGVFLAVASLAIWGLRVLVRLYLLNIHLEADAQERVVMAETYLALLERGTSPTDEERRIVMQALFKRTVTGLAKEEGGSNSLIEAVSKAVSGSR